MLFAEMREKQVLLGREGGSRIKCFVEFKMSVGHASIDIEKALVLLLVSKVAYYTSGFTK